MQARVNEIVKKVHKLQGRKEEVLARLKISKSKLNKYEETNRLAREAMLLIQQAAEATQKQLKIRVEKLVSLALNDVFEDEAYSFELVLKTTRKTLAADFLFVDKKGEKFEPLFSCGYGEVDVACFALRIVMMLLKGTRKTLIMDEPFKNVSQEYRDKLGQFVQKICEELGIQIIATSHIVELKQYAGKVFLVNKTSKGVSQCQEVAGD